MSKAASRSKRGATSGFGAATHERPVPRISIHAFCEFPDTRARSNARRPIAGCPRRI